MSNKVEFSAPAVLVSKLNPKFPRIWFVRDEQEARMVASTEFVPLIARDPFAPAYVEAAVSTERFTARLRTMAGGTSTSHQRVKPSDVLSAPAIIPPTPIVELANRQFEALSAMRHSLHRSITNLAKARQSLHSRLIYGGAITTDRNTEMVAAA
jgi:type I restriction enzyme S subunit